MKAVTSVSPIPFREIGTDNRNIRWKIVQMSPCGFKPGVAWKRGDNPPIFFDTSDPDCPIPFEERNKLFAVQQAAWSDTDQHA